MLKMKSHTLQETLALIVCSAACSCFLITNAIADIACPSKISSNNPRRTTTDAVSPIPLETLITYEVVPLGDVYRIPAGYTWASSKDTKTVIKTKALGFSFWMPSMRYPERNMGTTPSFRPCEDGHPSANKNQSEYIVKVVVEPVDEDADHTPSTPLQKYKNLISSSYKGGEQAFDFVEEYGLLRFAHKNQPEAFVNYRHLKKTEPEILIRCAKPEDKTPNPLCDGFIYYPSKNLNFYMKFSTQDLPHWHEMADAVHVLLKRWQVNNLKESQENMNK